MVLEWRFFKKIKEDDLVQIYFMLKYGENTGTEEINYVFPILVDEKNKETSDFKDYMNDIITCGIYEEISSEEYEESP